jgi:hypothetical protein
LRFGPCFSDDVQTSGSSGFGSVEQANDVSILLDGSGVSEITESRAKKSKKFIWRVTRQTI